MESLHGSVFSRRPERDGTIVSTCDTCFAAVAISLRVTDLERAEHEHSCNPETLDNWRMFVAEIKLGQRRRQRIKRSELH